MLDIKLIRENFEEIKKKVASKKIKVDLDELIRIDNIRREELNIIENKKSLLNKKSKEIGMIKRNNGDIKEASKEMKNLSSEIKDLDKKYKEIEKKYNELYFMVPNLPHKSVPFGNSEDDNVVYQEAEGIKEVEDYVKDHVEIAEKLGLIDFKRGTKISGSGFPLYRNFGARLERAIINFMLDLHTQKHGYEEILPPLLVKRETAFGTGQLPKSEDQMYYAPEDDLFAVPTAEVPVTNIYKNEVLKEDELTKKFVAFTPCFRREAGSWGKDTRGLLRLHQFNKVELVKYSLPENSYDELELLRKDAEEVLQLLKLPYRILNLCTADLSFAAAKCYDLEVWAPGTGKFLEVSSCSNFEDFQARRMNIKYKDKNKKNKLIHTLNGSGVATARLMVAILENYQNEDGSVTIPDVLRPYLGGLEVYGR